MKKVQKSQQGPSVENVSDEFRELVFEHMPAMGHLLDNLDAGVTPNWLDVLLAVSQSVDYYTVGAQEQCRLLPAAERGPGQYCSSC